MNIDSMDSIPIINNTNKPEVMAGQKRSYRSNSIDLVSLNKTFSELNVQPNKKPEKNKKSIDKINEIILGSEKYYIPEKPILNVNTKLLSRDSSRRNSFNTPVSATVDFNGLLKSLEDLTSEVKRSKCEENPIETNKPKEESKTNTCQPPLGKLIDISDPEDEKSIEEKQINSNKSEESSEDNNENTIEKPKEPSKQNGLKHSGSFRYLLSLGKKISNENLKSTEENNNMPCFTDIIQNSKNYILNLAKKTTEEVNNSDEESNEEVENKEQQTTEIKNKKVGSRKSSDATMYKSEAEQLETTKKGDTKKDEGIEEEDDSIVNNNSNPGDNSVINLYSKNRDSINLDVYMNADVFPNSPITPISPPDKKFTQLKGKTENKTEEKPNKQNKPNNSILESQNKSLDKPISVVKEKTEEKRNNTNNSDAIKKFESLALPKLPLSKLGHKKSNSEVIKIPIDKEKNQIRRTYSKDNLEALKNLNVEASFKGISNDEDQDMESNPTRHDSIRYSKTHTLFYDENSNCKRKSFLNNKNNNSNHLRKKQTQNKLSSNRSSINIQDIQDIKDLTKTFYVSNKNFSTTKATNNETGKDSYYIKRLNNEIEDKSAAIKMYRNTRKLSDVTSKHQRTSSMASNCSLPIMNNNNNFKYDKITISPNLMSKSLSPSLMSKTIPKSQSPNLMSKSLSPSLMSKTITKSQSPNLMSKSLSPNLMSKTIPKSQSPNLMSKTIPKSQSPNLKSLNMSPSLMSKTMSPSLMSKTIPNVKSSLSNQSFNADDIDFENKRKISVTSIREENSLKLMTNDIEKDKNIEKVMDSLEAIKKTRNKGKDKMKEENPHFKPSWAKNSSKHNSVASNNSREEKDEYKIPELSKKPEVNKNELENNFYVASPQKKQYQSGLVFTKRNSSLTRFSVMGPRTRHSVAQPNDISIKNKYYRYSVTRNLNTYNNSGNLPIPSHHTKLTIPHFNPSTQLQYSQVNRKDSVDSTTSQETLMMEGSANTSRIDSMAFANTSKSFLFRDTRDSKNRNISNIISDIKEEENIIEEPPIDFSFIHNSKSLNDISQQILQPADKKAEIVSKINVTEIPFLYNKEQANWETSMHTMSLYDDDDNSKPKKSKKGFRKLSFFKKNKKH